MSLIHEKENTTDLILETDGTLTIEGATYIHLGNYTLDEFRAKKAAEDQALIEEQEHVHSENVTSSDAPLILLKQSKAPKVLWLMAVIVHNLIITHLVTMQE